MHCPFTIIHPKALTNNNRLKVLKLVGLLIDEFDIKLIRHLENLRLLEILHNQSLNKVNLEGMHEMTDLRRFLYYGNLEKLKNVNRIGLNFIIYKLI